MRKTYDSLRTVLYGLRPEIAVKIITIILLVSLCIIVIRALWPMEADGADYDYQFCDSLGTVEICAIGAMPEEALWMSTWNDDMRDAYENGGMMLFLYMSESRFSEINGDWLIIHIFLTPGMDWQLESGCQIGLEYPDTTIWSEEIVLTFSPEQRHLSSSKQWNITLIAPEHPIERGITAHGTSDAYKSWKDSSMYSKARNGAYVAFVRYPKGSLNLRDCDMTRCKVSVPRCLCFRDEGGYRHEASGH